MIIASLTLTVCCSSQCITLCAGNDNLHFMTARKRQRLRVELTDANGKTTYAEYDNFKVDSEKEKYRLISVGSYSGTAGEYRMAC